MNDFTHRPPRNWTKVSLLIPEEQAELAAAALYTFTGNGVEILEDATADRTKKLIAYINQDEKQAATEARIRAFHRELLMAMPAEQSQAMNLENLQEEDWNATWKKDLKPIRIGTRLLVMPSWEAMPPAADDIVLRIDPGMAFGTGLHATTQLAMELIETCFNQQPPQRVLDVGTGTGILAITCGLLGAREVIATDLDPDAVHAAHENARLNGVEKIVSASDRDLPDLPGKFDLIVANITHDVLLSMAPALTGLLADHGRLILTGLLREKQADSLAAAGKQLGLTLVTTQTREEWAALLLRR